MKALRWPKIIAVIVGLNCRNTGVRASHRAEDGTCLHLIAHLGKAFSSSLAHAKKRTEVDHGLLSIPNEMKAQVERGLQAGVPGERPRTGTDSKYTVK
jgi:hypothetical protein